MENPRENPNRSPVFFDVDQAAAISELSPETIRTYAKRGRLERGQDFVVHTWYFGHYRRRTLRLTRRGILRLVLREWRSS